MAKVNFIEVLGGNLFEKLNNEAIERGGNVEVVRIGRLFAAIENMIDEGRMKCKKLPDGFIILDGQEGGVMAIEVVKEFYRIIDLKKED